MRALCVLRLKYLGLNSLPSDCMQSHLGVIWALKKMLIPCPGDGSSDRLKEAQSEGVWLCKILSQTGLALEKQNYGKGFSALHLHWSLLVFGELISLFLKKIINVMVWGKRDSSDWSYCYKVAEKWEAFEEWEHTQSSPFQRAMQNAFLKTWFQLHRIRKGV